jgi:hypothetical protein
MGVLPAYRVSGVEMELQEIIDRAVQFRTPPRSALPAHVSVAYVQRRAGHMQPQRRQFLFLAADGTMSIKTAVRLRCNKRRC